jgi:hypothetical protein
VSSTDSLIMDLTEQECRAALLILAHATTSLGCDGARQVEEATVTAISEVLAKTRAGAPSARRTPHQ